MSASPAVRHFIRSSMPCPAWCPDRDNHERSDETCWSWGPFIAASRSELIPEPTRERGATFPAVAVHLSAVRADSQGQRIVLDVAGIDQELDIGFSIDDALALAASLLNQLVNAGSAFEGRTWLDGWKEFQVISDAAAELAHMRADRVSTSAGEE